MDKSKKYKETVELIFLLTDAGKDILEIEINDEIVFFLVEGFEPPIGGTIQAVPYIKFNGTCIDDFLKNSIYAENNKAGLISNFDSKRYQEKSIQMKFGENHKWRFYSK